MLSGERICSYYSRFNSLCHYARQHIYAIARLCDSDVSVCLSVRPSVTRRYCA